MLERITATDGVVVYRSPLLHQIGVPHGFSTRIGGVSHGPFASLNLGNPNGAPVQDDPANIAANYARLHEAIGAAERRRLFVHQVHGDQVRTAPESLPFDCNAKADAIVTDDPAVVAAVRVADCVPVLLATADGRVVAAVHAGWRGVVAGVVVRAVEQLLSLCAARRRTANDTDSRVVAAIGPSISFDAFEIGPEVVDEFRRAFGNHADELLQPSANIGKFKADLRAALRRQLLEAGVKPGDIDDTTACTYRQSDEFFSHRRDDGLTGRMAALIGPDSHGLGVVTERER